MRIAAVTAHVRHDRPAGVHPVPARTVSVTPPRPLEAGPMTVALLTGRGILVDVVC